MPFLTGTNHRPGIIRRALTMLHNLALYDNAASCCGSSRPYAEKKNKRRNGTTRTRSRQGLTSCALSSSIRVSLPYVRYERRRPCGTVAVAAGLVRAAAVSVRVVSAQEPRIACPCILHRFRDGALGHEITYCCRVGRVAVVGRRRRQIAISPRPPPELPHQFAY